MDQPMECESLICFSMDYFNCLISFSSILCELEWLATQVHAKHVDSIAGL